MAPAAPCRSLTPPFRCFWVSANTSLTFLCVVTAGSPATGSVLPSQASLQHPQAEQKVWLSCPKLSLATFMGAQALTGEFKELRVLCETAGMPIPTGSHSQSLQEENSGSSRQMWCPGDGGRRRNCRPVVPRSLNPGLCPRKGAREDSSS